MSGVSFVRAVAECPYCEVRKNQIDTDPQRAVQIVNDAMDRHVAETHPEADS